MYTDNLTFFTRGIVNCMQSAVSFYSQICYKFTFIFSMINLFGNFYIQCEYNMVTKVLLAGS